MMLDIRWRTGGKGVKTEWDSSGLKASKAAKAVLFLEAVFFIYFFWAKVML